MSENLAEEYADTLVESLTELWDAMDDSPDSEFDGYETPDEALMAMPLEIVREVGERFQVLLTSGGPNAWIESDAQGDYAGLIVVWGRGRAKRYGPVVDRTAQWFAGLYE